MKKNNLAYLFLLSTIIPLNSCSKNDNEECSIPEIITTVNKSHPCLSTGTIKITAPADAGYRYKLDQGDFQANTVFENISVGKHMVSIKDNNGCEASKEVEVDTITKGSKFTEVATVLKSRCSACHSGVNPQAGIDFTRICDILSHWNRIQARAVEGNPSPMPPTGFIPIEERNKILLWINSGHMYEE
ncbi:hypothetical protein [Chryseobacterium salviniae]|uniref:Cytochrome c domain-containing protein n=1 Tax=Chryseobacterium salviniae TaxID=3101750 RepID=A0ABU6HP65_9FLAO|nr:hypothetical protein [Chryseobacterium sp. T9W2-O]MEC3874713.1 hypothetical protein [Chryseobacterium sp. T9W2-O]